MSLTVADRFADATPHATQARTAGVPALVLVALGSLLSFALCWSTVLVIWRTGTFFDTDDAMRMVQVRAWMAGQGWYDLVVHRLDPPAGLLLHWSRVVDVPIACLIRLFGLALDPVDAERLARIVFPLGLQAALIAAVVHAGRVLVGPAGALPAMVLAVTSAMQFGQFVPGRVDHHAPQITLLVLMAGCAANAMLRARPRSALVVAGAMAVSMAISLENLPFIAVLVAALALTWVATGAAQAPMLRAFGAGLAVAAMTMFAATVPPSRYAVVVTDAFALPHLLAAVLGGLTLAGLSFAPLEDRVRRAAALGVAGLAVLAAVAALCPGVLASPYGQIDPVVRSVWLARVTEALPLTTAVRLHPQAGTLIVAPLLAGLLAMAVAAFRGTGRVRGVWLMLLALTLTGLAGAMWEVRVVASTTPLALLGGVWAFTRFFGADGFGSAPPRRLLGGIALLLAFAPMAWAVVPVPDESATTARSTADADACRAADNLAPLAALPPGIVFAPIDSGSHLLAHTGLSVIGAPYHRNNHGNRMVIDGFSAEGAAAERIVRDAGARYVALCPGQVQAEALTQRNPDGLAAQILAGHPPSWLRPLDIAGTTYRVFAVD